MICNRYIKIWIVFVVIFFVAGCGSYEKKKLRDKDPWISASQELNPDIKKFGSSVILVHGFVGSPYDMKQLALYLQKKGFRVVIPLMEGQTYLTPLNKRRTFSSEYYIHWLSDIVEKERRLTGQMPAIIGFSMGGALATIVAEKKQMETLVLIAPFYKLSIVDDWIWDVTRIIKYVMPYVIKTSKGKINDPEGYQAYYPGSYVISLHAFNHLGTLAFKARKSAESLSANTLIWLSENDTVASPEAIFTLFGNKPGVLIKKRNTANHILLFDHNALDMIHQIADFLSENMKTE